MSGAAIHACPFMRPHQRLLLCLFLTGACSIYIYIFILLGFVHWLQHSPAAALVASSLSTGSQSFANVEASLSGTFFPGYGTPSSAPAPVPRPSKQSKDAAARRGVEESAAGAGETSAADGAKDTAGACDA